MGVSILPDFVYDSTDPDLTTVPFDYDRFLEYGIVYNYNSLSQPGKRFIKWLELYKEFFRNSEWLIDNLSLAEDNWYKWINI